MQPHTLTIFQDNRSNYEITYVIVIDVLYRDVTKSYLSG